MHLQTDKQRQLVRDILMRADRVIAVGKALRGNLIALCPDLKVDVIGNVVETEFFTPPPATPFPTGPFRFFFLGVLNEGKGVHFLIQATRELINRGLSSFQVWLGGDGSYRSVLENHVRSLRVQDHCQFLGMLDRNEARQRMRACDVFVLPSLGETFGIVVGEAMACGKPVLATCCGGPEDLVTAETGLLVPPANAHALADAMAGFLTRRHCFETDKIRDSVVCRFGEEVFLDRIEFLYKEILVRQKMKNVG
jgi:glycosyltransferase involved in cell wall biosynthesis